MALDHVRDFFNVDALFSTRPILPDVSGAIPDPLRHPLLRATFVLLAACRVSARKEAQ